MTIVMQSSSAAAATTLVALDAGSLTFEQGCAMVVGQSIGTAATSALAAIGGGLAVRRTALAHVIFSLIVGVLGLLFLGPLTAAADWVGARLDNPDGVLALAAFSTIFKLAGVLVFYPWLDHYSRFIVRISGRGSETSVSRLEPTVAQAGGDVALEAAWRATLEVARSAVDAVRRRFAGEPVTYASQSQAIQQIGQFVESISLDTIDPREAESRLVRLCHALDHLEKVDEDLTHIPPAVDGWHPPAAFEASARALAGWIDATRDPTAAADPALLEALEDASRQLGAACSADRDRLLSDLALQRTPAERARGGIETLAWAEPAFHHAWRVAESLRVASGRE
jgi:phosphate:Na+ symporter